MTESKIETLRVDVQRNGPSSSAATLDEALQTIASVEGRSDKSKRSALFRPFKNMRKMK